jgi:hypothetical protein
MQADPFAYVTAQNAKQIFPWAAKQTQNNYETWPNGEQKKYIREGAL